jgi:hypothetical protein
MKGILIFLSFSSLTSFANFPKGIFQGNQSDTCLPIERKERREEEEDKDREERKHFQQVRLCMAGRSNHE